MSNITASMVQDLRARTGLGILECKKALQEAEGNIELAIENLRKSSALKAEKKSDRIAAEGAVLAASQNGSAAIVEVNCETDFVAKDESFIAFADSVLQAALSGQTFEAMQSGTLEEARMELVQKIGENIRIRRVSLMQNAHAYAYLHNNQRIGAILSLDGDNSELGLDLAMQVVSMRPEVIHESEVPQATVDKEREIATAQSQDSGKSPEIIAKMVEGRIAKFKKESSLMGQVFVKDGKQSVAALCKSKGQTPTAFVCFALGEGIEKDTTDFADEVRAQVAQLQPNA